MKLPKSFNRPKLNVSSSDQPGGRIREKERRLRRRNPWLEDQQRPIRCGGQDQRQNHQSPKKNDQEAVKTAEEELRALKKAAKGEKNATEAPQESDS